MRHAAFALLLLASVAQAAPERVPVVYSDGAFVYVAWSAVEGAREGARVELRGADGMPTDTLEVVWTRDAITALRGSAAASEENVGKLVARDFCRRARRIENKTGATIRMVKAAIREKTALRFHRFTFWERPLDAAAPVEHAVIIDPSNLAGLAAGDFLQDVEDRFRRAPAAEHR